MSISLVVSLNFLESVEYSDINHWVHRKCLENDYILNSIRCWHKVTSPTSIPLASHLKRMEISVKLKTLLFSQLFTPCQMYTYANICQSRLIFKHFSYIIQTKMQNTIIFYHLLATYCTIKFNVFFLWFQVS